MSLKPWPSLLLVMDVIHACWSSVPDPCMREGKRMELKLAGGSVKECRPQRRLVRMGWWVQSLSDLPIYHVILHEITTTENVCNLLVSAWQSCRVDLRADVMGR